MEQLLEMACIASKNQNEDMSFIYRVYVYGGEKSIPHIHLYRRAEDIIRKIGICIRLDKVAYYPHDNYRDTLNSKELKEFISWLQKENKYITGKTNYQAACEQWNSNNPDFEHNFGGIMDYSKLNIKSESITIKENVKIPGTDIILEAGDKIELVKEGTNEDNFMKELVSRIPYKAQFMKVENSTRRYDFDYAILFQEFTQFSIWVGRIDPVNQTAIIALRYKDLGEYWDTSLLTLQNLPIGDVNTKGTLVYFIAVNVLKLSKTYEDIVKMEKQINNLNYEISKKYGFIQDSIVKN